MPSWSACLRILGFVEPRASQVEVMTTGWPGGVLLIILGGHRVNSLCCGARGRVCRLEPRARYRLGLDQTLICKAEVAVLTYDHVIQHPDPHHPANLTQPAGDVQVSLAGLRVT